MEEALKRLQEAEAYNQSRCSNCNERCLITKKKAGGTTTACT